MLLLIGSEKGGAGKTTVAVTLASMCALAGRSTILVDTDVQESASIWGAVRAESDVHPPVPVFIKHGKVGYDLLQLKDRFDVVIIDAGGRDSIELRQSIAVADVMIVPVRPSQFDTWSIAHMVQLFKGVEEAVNRLPEICFLLNAVSPNPMVKEPDELRTALADSECAKISRTLVASLTDRIAFRRSVSQGLSVVEVASGAVDNRAIAEVLALYREVFHEEFTPNAAGDSTT